MKTIIFAAILALAGCSDGCVERTSTYSFSGYGNEPSVQILYYGPGGNGMDTYRVLVHNAFYVSISVTLDCSTSGIEKFVLKPRTTRQFLMSGIQGRGPECNVSYTRE